MSCETLDVGFQVSNIQGECSGHGVCDAVAKCVCESGWTGSADIISTNGDDCQLNLNVIRGLWVFNLVVGIVMLVKSIPRIRIRYEKYVEMREAKRGQGRKFGIWNNRGLLAVYFYIFICYPSVTVYGIMKIVNPDLHLGFNPALSLFFLTARIGFYGAVYSFQPALLQSVLRGKSQTKALVRLADKMSFVLCFAAALLGIAPFISMSSPEGNGTANLVAWYLLMGGTGVQVILFGSQAWYIEKAVTKVLTESFSLTKSPKTIEMKDALRDMQKQVQVQAAFQATVYLLFAAWPFLYNKHDYFLPIGWLAYHILGKKLAYTQVAPSNTGSSDMSSSVASQQSGSDDHGFAKDVSSFNETSAVTSQVRELGHSFSGLDVSSEVSSTFYDKKMSFHDPQDASGEDDDYV